MKSGENRYLRHASYYWLARPRPDLDALPREVACSLLRGFMHITVWCGEYQSWDASRRSRAPSQHTIVLLAPAGCRVNGCEPDTRCACAGQGPLSNSPLHSSLRWKNCTHGMNQRWESKSGGGGEGGRWLRGAKSFTPSRCSPGRSASPCHAANPDPTPPHTMCLYVYKHDMRSVACAEEAHRTPCEGQRHQDHFVWALPTRQVGGTRVLWTWQGPHNPTAPHHVFVCIQA